VTTGFQLRAPWYERERGGFDLRDPRARRPTIQMYDRADFVDQVTKDPGNSLKFTLDDRWSYPVPVIPGGSAKGRDRFITSKLVHTSLRKLYQPSHSRFYVVVVEVFCDTPGLPRAGSHGDIGVSLVMRRQHTAVGASRAVVRRLARTLMADLAKDQHQGASVGEPDLDVHELWWGTEADRVRFEQDHSLLLDQVEAQTTEQAWMVGAAGGQWRALGVPPAPDRPQDDREEELPMWRLPPRADDCDAARTRSLWFGLVPTYSADHWTDERGTIQPKLDNSAIYQLRCLVKRPPERGHEHCPPVLDVSEPTRPFRLAAAYDPDGTKNHTVSITAPDLRRLAARAGQKQGPGGVRITTPPKSGLGPISTKSMPAAGLGSLGGGSICTFAIELFFIVAFFLFLLFLPIVVLAFQLWWMLALRFCIPPSASFKLLAEYFAAGGLLVDLAAGGPHPKESAALDEVIGVPDAAKELVKNNSTFATHPEEVEDLVAGIDPTNAQPSPVEPDHLVTPPDPLCPVG